MTDAKSNALAMDSCCSSESMNTDGKATKNPPSLTPHPISQKVTSWPPGALNPSCNQHSLKYN